MVASYKWHPITDLTEDPQSLTDGELESLGRVWKTEKEKLIEQQVLVEFGLRLRREWAIETGIIEDVYTLDRGVTRTLIEKGIDAALIPHNATNKDTNLVARVIQDHYEALDGMFDFVAGNRPLSTSYIKELHAALLRNLHVYTVVDQFGSAFEKTLEKGQYKSEANSPTRPDGSVHECCPPEHVSAEMDALLRIYSDHQIRALPPEVEAAWLHHCFTQIHPFSDGNGRVARALASLVFIRSGWFPLIIKRDDRQRYIEALEKADGGELRPLVALFVECQRSALIEASEIAYDVQPITSTQDAVLAARDRLIQRGKLPLKEWLRVTETGEQLVAISKLQLQVLAESLTREIGSLGKGFSFNVQREPEISINTMRDAVVRAAGIVPDYASFNAFVTLMLNAGRNDVLAISFQSLGPRFRGFIGVVAYLAIQNAPGIPIAGPSFQVNYEEDPEVAKTRFSKWLEGVTVRGLNMWRNSL